MQPKTPPLNLVAIRQRYQKALLTWLKEPEVDQGLRQMRAVLGAVALIQPPEFVPFWRDAEALMIALLDQRLAVDPNIRKVISKLDAQFKQLVQGNPAPDAALWHEIKQLSKTPVPSVVEAIEIASVPEVSAVPLTAEQEASTLAAEQSLAQTKNTLAEMLAKTASILPFVAQAQLPRFSPEATAAWAEAVEQLLAAWDKRYQDGWSGFRSTVFGVCGAALTIGEQAFLRFSEALASAMDRVDDELEPPPHLVAAIAASIECMGERDFLEHTALYERLDLFSARLEKVVAEEIRVARVQYGNYIPEPESIPEVKVPQPSFEMEEIPVEAVWQPLVIGEEGLRVDEIPVIQWSEGGETPSQKLAFSPEVEAEEADETEEAEPNAVEIEPSVAIPGTGSVFQKTSLADAQLLGRVARDLEALADSLHLSGLARQAGDLASLVDRVDQAGVQHPELRADLLQVIQFMQDQVGAVVMGFPPHANPKITGLMQKLEGYLPT